MKGRLWLQVVVLVTVSSAMAVLTNAVRPNRLDWIVDPETSVNPGENSALADRVAIGLEELQEHLTLGTAAMVDTRKSEEYAAGHVATAVNIPSTEKEQYLDRVFEMLPPDGLIIIYCEGGDCESSREVFEFLVHSGFSIENLRIYDPGWEVLGALDDLPIAYEID